MNVTKMKKQVGFTLISKACKGFTLKSKAFKGFTLIELLVVMAILGLLATVGLASFRNSQLKSRDAKRKSDLEQVQRALEMYHNDHAGYPTSNDLTGQIIVEDVALSWSQAEMKDRQGTLYMKELPGDPTANPQYCYRYVTGPPAGYQLYAKLENSQDPHCIGGSCTADHQCGTGNYNYGVASSNLSP